MFCLPWNQAAASDLDTIGATALRQADPALTGAGVAVIQAEAPLAANTFEVNPAYVGLSPSTFTYVNIGGSIANSPTFPNSVGSESSHADVVAACLTAVAPGVGSVDNYDANYYYSQIVAGGQTPSSVNPALHDARIVNQSFVFTNTSAAENLAIDKLYDSYAAQNNVLFVSGAGNGVSPPQPPSTAYNGICVNAISMTPATLGPTSDGRSKPDLTAPGNETSYSTADVSGAAALLLQAADRGEGGTGTAANAGDIRMLKALLLNGASKPSGWTHTATAPLDPQYGAGMVDVYESWLELKAGNQTVSASAPSNQLQSPVNLRLSSGWDLGSLPNGSTTNHYFFTSPQTGAASDTFTATLDWNVSQWDGAGNAVMNNLDLALYDTTTNTPSLVSISDSMVDNVQQVYAAGLAPGHTYDLRVYDSAARVGGGAETYGLAFSAGASVSLVPEPSALVLLAAAVACCLAGLMRRRKKA
jgi:hypothetical protein